MTTVLARLRAALLGQPFGGPPGRRPNGDCTDLRAGGSYSDQWTAIAGGVRRLAELRADGGSGSAAVGQRSQGGVRGFVWAAVGGRAAGLVGGVVTRTYLPSGGGCSFWF